MMKVSELIERLQQMPQDAIVIIETANAIVSDGLTEVTEANSVLVGDYPIGKSIIPDYQMASGNVSAVLFR